MEMADRLKKENASPEAQDALNTVFREWMSLNQNTTAEFKKALDTLEKYGREQEALREEKRRLEALFVSGIIFTSINQMQPLMEKAITTVVRELKADAGFIVLVDEEARIVHTFPHNMDPERDADAREMSRSVIRKALENNEPVNLSDQDTGVSLFQANSILSLGIKSALCVPLMAPRRVMGAVYVDRRHTDVKFTNAELSFLIAFARQIVQGMDINRERADLEKKLIDDAMLDFNALRDRFKSDYIIGHSKKLFEVLRVASKISPTNASVIILGENGTGKELLARALHENSRRAGQPFVAINCSAIPKDLLESELFGYEKGAFTNAVKDKPGKFETASGGTLFLDEIGDMSVTLQAKLLRVLQTGEIERLGSVKPRQIDVRVIAATNRDLQKLIREGAFREDLYYRLKVVELTLPPLRERKEDIEELTRFFMEKHKQSARTPEIDSEALLVLENYDWPGNIRELENVILRALVLAVSDCITIRELPEELVRKTDDSAMMIQPGSTLAEAENAFRRMYVLKALRQAGSKAEAAKLLGINRTHFYRILSQLEIE